MMTILMLIWLVTRSHAIQNENKSPAAQALCGQDFHKIYSLLCRLKLLHGFRRARSIQGNFLYVIRMMQTTI